MNIFNKIKQEILTELFKIRNPHLDIIQKTDLDALDQTLSQESAKEKIPQGFHNLPPKKAYFELTTARNRNLINIDEQNRLRKTVVGFFGLSVGSHAATTWMIESRADYIKICDPDIIAPTNLNRLRFGWNQIGTKKIDAVKEILTEINPYCHVEASFYKNPEMIKHLAENNPQLQIIVDAIDDMEGKIILRKIARKLKIPLLSAADVGDNIILDIERYDLDPQPDFFLGRIPNIENIHFSELTDKQKKKLIIQLVGFEHNSKQMIESLMAIKGSVVTWPQLGATATLSGGILATTIKKIILKDNVQSGRYYFSLDEILIADHHNQKNENERKKLIQQMKTILNDI